MHGVACSARRSIAYVRTLQIVRRFTFSYFSCGDAREQIYFRMPLDISLKRYTEQEINLKLHGLWAIPAMALILASAKPASASLLDGQTVVVQYAVANDSGYTPIDDPNGYSVDQSSGPIVVPGSINGLRFGIFDVSIGDDFVSITNTNDGTAFCCSLFNQGILVTLVNPNPATIASVTYDNTSNLGNAGDVDFNAHQVFFSVLGEVFVTGTAKLDVAGVSAAPEPGTLAMSIGGILLALAAARRTRKA
jgi:hypothetical protein